MLILVIELKKKRRKIRKLYYNIFHQRGSTLRFRLHKSPAVVEKKKLYNYESLCSPELDFGEKKILYDALIKTFGHRFGKKVIQFFYPLQAFLKKLSNRE